MTLIELLVVIVILMLLVTILMPSLFRVQVLARTAQTKTIINTLSNACSVYQQEFRYFPDADEIVNNRGDDGLQGRHRLVRSFCGPGDNGWTLGDGEVNARRAKRYDTNFFGVTELTLNGSDPTRAFRDPFGNDIYYYVKRLQNPSLPPSTTNKLVVHGGDNDEGPAYATDDIITGGTDFLLLSKGYTSTKWDDYDAAKRTVAWKSDVTNFSR